MTNFLQPGGGSAVHVKRVDNPPPLRQRLRPPLTTQPWRIILYIGTDSVTSMGLELTTPLTLGRADLAEGHIPGVDLGPFGALDAGVSRRHAVLFCGDDGLYIRDLGSTNGTQINGFALQPKQSYRLRSGDKIELGRLQLSMSVVHTPGR